MLIQNAEIWGGDIADVRIAGGHIVAMGTLVPFPDEDVCDARHGALLPGLHDHHIHLFALAASLDSVHCGPPDVTDGVALRSALRTAAGEGWVRGIGYHDSVAGHIDRDWLDAALPDRPVRVQHRGGRLWMLNSRALEALTQGGVALPDGAERLNGLPTGRLYESDGWLRQRLGGGMPDLTRVSTLLASFGVTGVTDMTPANDDAIVAYLSAQQASGALRQSLLVAGRRSLSEMRAPMLHVLATKFHLHEGWLPDFDILSADIGDSHAAGRPVAIHCVTRTELVFALAAIRAAGPITGDRIEHASVAPDALIDDIVAMGLGVVSQPHFITERGDAYAIDVEADDRPWLYRAKTFLSRGVAFAGGTDAPFGGADPWAAIRAAVSRRVSSGTVLGPNECLSPEEAMALFLADGERIEHQRTISPGAIADICLLDRPWRAAREWLDAGLVRLVLRGGTVIYGPTE